MHLIMENFRNFIKEEEEEPTNDPNLIRQAFANTDPSYLEASIKQRTPGPESAGSVFSAPTSIEDLISAPWEKYSHPAISSPAIGFKAPIPGVLGIADINDSSVPNEVIFQPAHGGKAMTKEPNPETGESEVLAEVVANIPEGTREVAHTTLLIGPSRGDPEKLQVWTFFPGDPTPQLPEVTLRDVQERFKSNETRIPGSKQDAIDLGYGFVKHAGS